MTNKLSGFIEMKRKMNIPSIDWKEFNEDTVLDDSILWTVRTAVYTGNDQSLPRKVGVTAEEASEFARQMLQKFKSGEQGIVIYYPYFVADKSGNLIVTSSQVVIEAVKSDLWNMVDNFDRDVTITYTGGKTFIEGDRDFLSEEEQSLLLKNVPAIKGAFRDDLMEGQGALLEWSFARNCNLNKEPVGEPYLVFYEARTYYSRYSG